MKCLYCAEEIQDAAIACRFCGRDMFFVRPIIERISLVEAKIDAVMAEMHAREITNAAVSAPILIRHQVWRLTIPAIVGAIVGVALFLMLFTPNTVDAAVLVPMLAPLPTGLWAAIWLSGRNIPSYALAGGGSGALVGAVMIFAGPRLGTDFDVPLVMGFLVIGYALSFTTGALVGDQIKRRYLPSQRASGLAERVARRLVHTSGNASHDNARIRRLADVFAALTPLLTFIGSIVTAYLTYQAALIKK